MFGWFRGRRSKETLKDRLELVLAYDRAKIAPGKVEALRNDLLEVVQRYFPSGNSKVEVEQDGDKVVLMASISIDEAGLSDDAPTPAGKPGERKASDPKAPAKAEATKADAHRTDPDKERSKDSKTAEA